MFSGTIMEEEAGLIYGTQIYRMNFNLWTMFLSVLWLLATFVPLYEPNLN